MSTYLTLVNLSWATTESLLYYVKLRKRTRLGLAVPQTSNQVLMWAIAMGAAAAVVAIFMILPAIGIPVMG